ncbi:MAG: ABC transporter ATP-binding protein, partial [Ferruginibacter sp.]
MSDSVIKVENLSKAYRIGLKEQRHDTLGATVAAWVKSPFKNFKQLKSLSNFNNQEEEDIFWALKDINFEVKKGEVLGIIGRNGAGKSTLLKILSRITEPTTGRIEIYGRVASLLEVGTGFNPELSGRENVYLNGTILGMTKKEIDGKFDEIIDFSGIEKFIDTPVKRYSSGMKVRLAFAVAAHLDSEILIIDEVLAVGDADFQKKCLGKMEELTGREQRTILFVSHNMAAVRSFCNKSIVLETGRLKFSGAIADGITHYSSHDNHLTGNDVFYDINLNNGQDV